MVKWQYKFNWRITLFTASCVAVFIYLSLWQFERADEKQRMQEAFDARRQSPPLELSELKVLPDLLNGQNVRLRGTYQVQKSFLLDNRVMNGTVGFEVISPLLTSDEDWDLVLVNRGWVAMGRTRGDPVDVGIDQDEVDSRGSVYIPEGEMFSLSQGAAPQGWPVIVQQLDVPAMAAQFPGTKRVFPYIVRLDETEPGAYSRFWPTINMRPEKHTAYAFQWMLMAVAVIVAYCWTSFGRMSLEARDG